MTIGDLISKKDYDYIEYRLQLKEFDDDIFAGCFSSKNGEIISLDGDVYSKDEKVLNYEEWKDLDENIENGLTVIIECNY